jgi:hypothetical protein
MFKQRYDLLPLEPYVIISYSCTKFSSKFDSAWEFGVSEFE